MTEQIEGYTENDRRFAEEMFRPKLRLSWRISAWLFDLAERAEPDVENRWWPESWAAKIPSSVALVFQGYWIRRYIWRHWRAGSAGESS